MLCSFLCGKKPIKLESSQGDFSVSTFPRTCFEVQLPLSTASSRPWQLSPLVVSISSAWCRIKTGSVRACSVVPYFL